jgi:TonB family protein
LVIGLSCALHAAILLTLPRHGGATGWTPAAPSMIDVQVEPDPVPRPKPLTPLANRATHPTPAPPYPVPPTQGWRPHDPSLAYVMARDEAPPKADTSTALTADDPETPRFTMILSSGTFGAGGIASTAAAPAAGQADGDGSAALPEPSVDTPARLVRGTTPSYPSEARALGVEAEVMLELVVSAAGVVEDVRVARGAGHGLDDAAVRAARLFRFSPAVKEGRAVRVRMTWSVEFRLD